MNVNAFGSLSVTLRIIMIKKKKHL